MIFNSTLWKGNFGDAYTKRNTPDPLQRTCFFNEISNLVYPIQSALEFGCGTASNLAALKIVEKAKRYHVIETIGVDINASACEIAHEKAYADDVYCCDIKDFPKRFPDVKADLVMTNGFLIHIPPSELVEVMNILFKTSNKYVLINEYFAPTPEDIPYHDFKGVLWKADFGGFFLASQKNVIPIAEGFLWRVRYKAFDNTTWWLFQKQ